MLLSAKDLMEKDFGQAFQFSLRAKLGLGL
jgi:hypothetical protein